MLFYFQILVKLDSKGGTLSPSNLSLSFFISNIIFCYFYFYSCSQSFSSSSMLIFLLDLVYVICSFSTFMVSLSLSSLSFSLQRLVARIFLSFLVVGFTIISSSFSCYSFLPTNLLLSSLDLNDVPVFKSQKKLSFYFSPGLEELFLSRL